MRCVFVLLAAFALVALASPLDCARVIAEVCPDLARHELRLDRITLSPCFALRLPDIAFRCNEDLPLLLASLFDDVPGAVQVAPHHFYLVETPQPALPNVSIEIAMQPTPILENSDEDSQCGVYPGALWRPWRCRWALLEAARELAVKLCPPLVLLLTLGTFIAAIALACLLLCCQGESDEEEQVQSQSSPAPNPQPTVVFHEGNYYYSY